MGNYSLTAKATDNAGAVATSAVVNVTVNDPSVLAAPTGLTVTGVTSSQVSLSWQDKSADETGFVLERATKSDFTGNVVSYIVDPNITSYVDQIENNKKGGGTFYYRVKAVKLDISSTYSNTVSTAPSVTAARTTQLSVYPNTFNKFVDLEFRGAEPRLYDVKVYSLLGKLLYEGTFTPVSEDLEMHRIDLSDTAIGEGMYLIQVENKETEFREIIRIVKTQ